MGAQSDPNKEVLYYGDTGELIGTESFSLDPFAGGSYLGKPIADLEFVTENLVRSGSNWLNGANYGVLDDGVLNFGFWNNIQELQNSYYVNDDGSIRFSEANPATFSAFSTAQRAVARTTIALWDDLIDISFRETRSGVADITYGNTAAGANVQAYAYLPFGDVYDDYYAQFGWETAQIGRLGGDVWIGGNVGSNFTPLQNSYYSVITQIHETGHALGLSHPGDYNASDDNDGIPGPDPITYTNDAYFAQDSLQYSVMSYFDAYETGAQHIDWTLTNFAYAATPLVHDVAAIQALYGVDTTTRTGDTVYGFNSTANRTAYDFTSNTRPIVTIWDAGGIDTIDFSGWNTPSVIDLNEGAFSSGGGTEQFLTLAQVNANRAALGFAPRSQATFNFYEGLKAQLGLTNGLFKDNVSIAYGATIENATGGGGNDRLIANNVANVLTGNGGVDFASYEAATAGVTVNLATGGTAGYAAGDSYVGIEGVIGSDFNDVLDGSAGDDLFAVSGGADAINGGAGSDTLTFQFAEAGVNVSLTGTGLGGHTLTSIENLTGSAFNDTLGGDSAANVINGGAGIDTLFYAGATSGVTVNLATGGTRGLAAGDTYVSIENITATNFADNLTGDAGVNVIQGGLGADTLTGGAGDVLSYADSAAAITINLGNNYAAGGTAARDVISGFDNVTASAFNDNITGDNDANTLTGGDGNDTLIGAAGADQLFGGIGNDSIRAGNDNDYIEAGNGNDTVLGDAQNDTLFGGAGDDNLNGGGNDDYLNGGTGTNTLTGGTGLDIFDFDTASFTDTITDFRTGLDKIDVSDIAGFTFIGGAAFSGANQLRFYTDGANRALAGDIDGDGVADLVIHLTGAVSVVAGDLILV
ncbi:hypothetical protein IP88_12340 [alpha proteobacterium AAP81b]|nr:hypothetical protein IP88_12340 [alpha proteobacterium AAP81b]